MAERVEVRRLMAWFNEKFFEEASNPLVRPSTIYKRFMSEENGGGAPATDVIRAAKVNVRYHLAYIGWLAQTRNFLAGDRLTYADLAAAAHLSAIDYLGDVPWSEDDAAKAWYARVKSRIIRPLLSEWLAGVPAVADLRGPRLLNRSAKLFRRRSEGRARARSGDARFRLHRRHRSRRDRQCRQIFPRILDAGAHGDMGWMAANPNDGRTRALSAGVRSIIVLGVNYGPDHENPLALLDRRTGRDQRLCAGGGLSRRGQAAAEAAGALAGRGDGAEIKVFVDTAPVMEKPLAQAAGIGWQGKHTNLLSRELGNWFFLGAVFTTLELPSDAPEVEHCGSCTACLDVCPTGAFPAPWRLDARRCISYLTIEHDGPVEEELRGLMGNRIYGCDDCLAVCPWNKFAAAARETGYLARAELEAPRLADLAALDDAGFRAVFAGSPIKRIGRDRFVRNVLYAIGNSDDASLAAEAERLLADASPLVRGAAVWALSQLIEREKFDALAAEAAGVETDESVRDEWRQAS